jgi:hypothetical protein
MKKLAVVVVLVVVAGWTWRALRRSDASDGKLLFHRFWVDHEPRAPKEQFQALFVNAEHPFGHFATRTMWTGQWEGFHYHVVPREEGTIDFLFGATNERQRVRYTARRCTENGFDFCLEITGSSRGARRYYSRKEWAVDSDDLETTRNLLQPSLSER